MIAKIIFIAALIAVSCINAEEAGKRSPFSIPLAKLAISFDDNTHVFEKVKVSFGNSPADDNYSCHIAPLTDYEVKTSKDGRQKFVHAEVPDKAYMMSDFEADVMNKVCKTFVQTLEIFEKDLQNKRNDRLLYLDSFFPRFLKGFYYLYCAVRNSPYALPKSICIADSEYDISLTSQKSDKRIALWQSQENQVIKLRIISKELIYQIKTWQKAELDNRDRNSEISYGKKVEEAFTLFMKIYFNQMPMPDLPKDGEHL